MIRRWWWLLVAATVLGAVAAYLVASSIQPTYTATTRLLTGPVSADFETLRASGELARTYAEVATSDLVLDPVAAELGVDVPRAELAKRITAEGNDVTRILVIDVTAASPTDAADLARALAEQMQTLSQVPSAESALIDEVLGQQEIGRLGPEAIQLVRQALRSALQVRPTGRLTVIEPAAVPTGPSEPQVPLLVLLGAGAGLVASGIFVLVRDRSRGGVSVASLRSVVGDERLVGRVTLSRRGHTRPAAILDRPDSEEAGAFRVVAERIRPEVGERSLLVSASSTDTSGSVAANLGLALADSGVQVVVLDTAAGSPVARALGSEPGPGSAQGNGRPPDRRAVSQPLADQGLLGLVSVSSTEPLSPLAARPLLDDLRDSGVLRVVAGPSVVSSANGLAWAREVDVVLLVADADTSLADIRDAVGAVSLAGAHLAGVVMIDDRGEV